MVPTIVLNLTSASVYGLQSQLCNVSWYPYVCTHPRFRQHLYEYYYHYNSSNELSMSALAYSSPTNRNER